MSDQQNGDGKGDRATVAMVLRTVDDLKELTKVQFDALHERLNGLDRLPEKVNALHERVVLDEARIALLEKADRESLSTADQRKMYRKVTLPALLISAAALIAAIAVPIVLHG